MGFTPSQINSMTPFEFAACTAGYARSHGLSEDPTPSGMSIDRARDLGIEGIV